jgi:UDP-glucose-4-epimerase GalE
VTILVTGGAGYIGSHTLRLLKAQHRDVVVLDSLVRGTEKNLLGAALEVADICDSAAVESICRKHNVDSVIHFAAYKSAGESMTHPHLYWQNNVEGTVGLVEGMLAANVRQIVFSSSAAVYGNPDQLPITESAAIKPENVYAETKAMMERIISWYGVTHGLHWVSLRYFNAAGASSDGVLGENWDITTNLIPLVMKAALGASGPIKVLGNDYPTPDGTGVRDYIHVEDLADAHAKAVDYLNDAQPNLTVNLGTGVGTSVLQILEATEKASGKPVPHEFAPRRLGDPAIVYADASLVKATLGWTATRSYEDIINSAFAWHQSQS